MNHPSFARSAGLVMLVEAFHHEERLLIMPCGARVKEEI
jgi:hypothetical protein